MDVSFKNNRTRLIALAPSTTVELPITPDIRNRYYQIYTGFELTEQQAAFNRKRIRDRFEITPAPSPESKRLKFRFQSK